ncbi:serine protease [Rhodobacteraceae bacterium D3-12]|nr:serine protease [Rhodobacteraceae bacterium D3-12]
MKRLFVTVILTLLIQVNAVQAQQDIAWVQIEAHPNLNTTQTRIRAYGARLPDVNGFSLGGGWYAIVLGPYTRSDAERVLQVYRAEREIPSDSFLAFSSAFRQQFWPVGADLLNLPQVAEPQIGDTGSATNTQPAAPSAPVEIIPADETPSQARRSEAALSREERMELQVMLKWAGHYTGGIDGAFGRGTRGSMASWQEANGFEKTGILTTKQRIALRKMYNAVLDGLDLQVVSDTTTGIEMKLPLGAVTFAKYSPPFAHFEAAGDIPARVLLISQQGDQNTLFGLYDIMQTLEVVPEAGPRERKNNSFVLIGEGADFISHTEARLEGGMVKGFTLVWPAGDEERRTRLLGEMQKSFKRLDGVMSPAAGMNEAQNIDLVAGLEIRRPKLSRSGFYVDAQGTVVTTVEAIAGCSKITLDGDHEADVVMSDAARGVAVLRARDALAPASFATLREGEPRLQSDVAVAGFSYEGVLGAPTMTFGKLSDVKGLRGESDLNRLALSALPGDAGGPVFDAGGAVMGMLLPLPEGDKKLPENVSFSMDSNTLRQVLEAAGISANLPDSTAAMAPEDLTLKAQGMTVLVSCW